MSDMIYPLPLHLGTDTAHHGVPLTIRLQALPPAWQPGDPVYPELPPHRACPTCGTRWCCDGPADCPRADEGCAPPA